MEVHFQQYLGQNLLLLLPQQRVDLYLQVSFGAVQTPEPGLDGSEGSVHYLMCSSVSQIIPKLCRGFWAVDRGHQPLPQRVTPVA